MSLTVIQHIAQIMTARRNCAEWMNQPLGGHAERMYRLHGAALTQLLEDCLPHGSGFDKGVSLSYEKTDVEAERFVFDAPFHCMNSDGYYVGWTSFTVTVTPSFIGGMNIEIERDNEPVDECDDESLMDMVCETIHEALSHTITLPTHYYADV